MIVLDASAAIEMVQKTTDSLALRSFIDKNEKTISCDLFRAEAASVFRKLARLAKLSPQEAERYFDQALSLVDEFYPIADLQSEALRESIRLDHSTYDLFYFVLTRRTGGTLCTLDRKLMHLCEKNHVSCISEISLES